MWHDTRQMAAHSRGYISHLSPKAEIGAKKPCHENRKKPAGSDV